MWAARVGDIVQEGGALGPRGIVRHVTPGLLGSILGGRKALVDFVNDVERWVDCRALVRDKAWGLKQQLDYLNDNVWPFPICSGVITVPVCIVAYARDWKNDVARRGRVDSSVKRDIELGDTWTLLGAWPCDFHTTQEGEAVTLGYEQALWTHE